MIRALADRPARLRGTGANQTTDQVRLYGDAATFLDRATAFVNERVWQSISEKDRNLPLFGERR